MVREISPSIPFVDTEQQRYSPSEPNKNCGTLRAICPVFTDQMKPLLQFIERAAPEESVLARGKLFISGVERARVGNRSTTTPPTCFDWDTRHVSSFPSGE